MCIAALFFFTGCPDPGTSGKTTIIARLIYDSTFEEDILIDVLTNATVFSETTWMGTSVIDAEVRINDELIPYNAPWGYEDDGTRITLIPGNNYTIKVVCNGQTFEETLVMPSAPDITSHNDGDAWDETALTNLAWTLAATTHDENQVFINWFDTQSGDDYLVTLPAATTNFDIPANTLEGNVSFPFGAGIEVRARTKFTGFPSAFDGSSYVLLSNEDDVGVDTSL